METGEYFAGILIGLLWGLDWGESRAVCSFSLDLPSKEWDVVSVGIGSAGRFMDIQTWKKVVVLNTQYVDYTSALFFSMWRWAYLHVGRHLLLGKESHDFSYFNMRLDSSIDMECISSLIF